MARQPRTSPLSPRRRIWVLSLALWLVVPAVAAAEGTEAADQVDQLSPDSMISRDAWRHRLQQARERAEQARREAASRPREAAPPPSQEQVATERMLGDETLQPGDVVSTGKGLFVFRGRSDDGGLILQPLPRPR